MVIESSSVRRKPVPEAVPTQQSSSIDGQPASEAAATLEQQAIVQQAEAAAEANDLAASDEIPPPSYGQDYGEIRNDNNGLKTRAQVTDDGRVDIQINQINHRLSKLFTPAFYQQTESPPPPPYIPPSERGGEDGLPPLPLNVVIHVVGSRGDVQPFIALGKVLKDKYGHRIRLATHPTFKKFVLENGLEFFSIGGDPSQLMAFMVKNPGLMPGFKSVLDGDVRQRRKDVAEYIQGCWRSCYEVGDGMTPDAADSEEAAASPFVADCIIANPPSFAHIHCAEKLGVPLHIMFTMPYSPTQAFPHPLANIQSSNADPQLTNYMSYAMIEVLTWQGLGDIINRFRTKWLDLDPVSLMWAPGMLERLKVPHTYCWSPALISKPKDWAYHISISGFCFLDLASNYTPAPDLQAFLESGPPPIYIGFGSIVLDDPNAMTELIFEAVRKTGQRVLLSKGWGGMGANELQIPEGVFILGNVPHDWLFKHVSCVVHHGGAGTTAAGIAAGRPTVIVPFFGDQPFWGAMIARARAGPDPIPHKQLTAENLTDAINFCLKPESLERAKELGSKMATEQGSDIGARSFHQCLKIDRLRCILTPSRPAVWSVKRSKVQLSAFAACTLANAKLLDFHNLELFRPQEYNTDEGPWDPLSGGSAAVFGTFSSMVAGLSDFPAETWKGVRKIGSSSSRKHSKEPTPANAKRNTNGEAADSRQPDASQSEVGTQCEPDSRQSYDMMRRTGVHTSKGFGKMAQTLVEAPMDISVSMTKGFHNTPKLWGDDTVRPQERITDFKSGAKATGKEFGWGMYDGITGLVTQPWKGAQNEGTIGFFKGLGKGIGGFAVKPGAALFSVPAYMMKGVQKEAQKLFGGNKVQNSIIASRIAQGYEEWTNSSDAEKQEVIDRWKIAQRYMKEKRKPDEMRKVMLEEHRKPKNVQAIH